MPPSSRPNQRLDGLSMARRVLFWAPVVVFGAALFWASSQHELVFSRDESWDFAIRKAGHFTVFAVGALLLWVAVAATTRLRPAAAWAAAVAIAFAASDELHQAFTAGRDPTLRDVLIDSAGAISAVVLARWWLARRNGRARPGP